MPDTPAAPIDPEERLIEIALDAGTGRARSVLWLCGVVNVLLGIVVGPLAATPFTRDPSLGQTLQVAVLAGATLTSCVTGVTFGVIQLVVAGAIGRGAKWAWYVGVALGVLYLPGCCLPFGALVLWGLLNARTRTLFLS